MIHHLVVRMLLLYVQSTITVRSRKWCMANSVRHFIFRKGQGRRIIGRQLTVPGMTAAQSKGFATRLDAMASSLMVGRLFLP